jgi:hypothetical protein
MLAGIICIVSSEALLVLDIEESEVYKLASEVMLLPKEIGLKSSLER